MRTVSWVVIVSLLLPLNVWAAQQTPSVSETAVWKHVATAMPLGTRVRAETASGRKLTGTLMSVSDDAITVKKRTRLPEPAVTIRFDELTRLETAHDGGIALGKAIGIGLAAGAGAVLGLFIIALAIGGD